MNTKLTALAASAALLTAAPAAQAGDLCTWVSAAVADLPNHFATIAAAPGSQALRSDLIVQGANNCGVIREATQHITSCFWVYPGMTDAAASAQLAALSGQVKGCLGAGYQLRASSSGGQIFYQDAAEDRAMTGRVSSAGAWQLYVMIVGHGAKLQ